MQTPTLEARCEKCNRVLSDPQSVALGKGPCCRDGDDYHPPYDIIVDSREQNPFFFENLRMVKSRGGGIVQPSIVIRGLPAGDYSLDGFESEIAIERKSLPDLYGTLGRGRDRFKREMEKLSALRFSAIVVEADWFDVLNCPPRSTLVPPQSIEGTVLSFQMDYPTVQWQFAMHRRHAEWICFNWLDRFWRKMNAKKDVLNESKMESGDGRDSKEPGPKSGVL